MYARSLQLKLLPETKRQIGRNDNLIDAQRRFGGNRPAHGHDVSQGEVIVKHFHSAQGHRHAEMDKLLKALDKVPKSEDAANEPFRYRFFKLG